MPRRPTRHPARSFRAAIPALRACLTIALLAALAAPVAAQRIGYPPEEFAARRQKLAERLESGLVLLVGKTLPASPGRFRQDNDFYYFTGSHDLNAVLVMDASTAEAHLFVPAANASELRSEGPNLLNTVLVTEGDPVVLSADVPREIDELLALVGRAGAPGTAAAR